MCDCGFLIANLALLCSAQPRSSVQRTNPFIQSTPSDSEASRMPRDKTICLRNGIRANGNIIVVYEIGIGIVGQREQVCEVE